ncbi:hypothetical protein B7494_g7991 [Chlorociboria aeruginascens]|nr:hypothetical protein B7494_g7991 [Chlorociboria aeruginascens]
MARKHARGSSLKEDENAAKRAKSSEAPTSRSGSATPADIALGNVPFSVRHPVKKNGHYTLSKKHEFQASPFAIGAAEDSPLDQNYMVTPWDEWNSMKRYNNFVIQGEVYKNNQFVFVRGESTSPVPTDSPDDYWVARILQVRAEDAQHVYALVAWMYWPSEIPAGTKPLKENNGAGGARKYHAKTNELIASSFMDVLDVLSFAGKAEVEYWDEADNEPPKNLYWRQTFCRETQELSAIRKHCVCDGYFNPEVSMYVCDNPECKVMFHEECLIDDILSRTYKESATIADGDSPEPAPNGSAKKKRKAGKVSKPWSGKFQAEIVNAEGEPSKVKITDERAKPPTVYTERIPCPKCGTELE